MMVKKRFNSNNKAGYICLCDLFCEYYGITSVRVKDLASMLPHKKFTVLRTHWILQQLGWKRHTGGCREYNSDGVKAGNPVVYFVSQGNKEHSGRATYWAINELAKIVGEDRDKLYIRYKEGLLGL